MGDGADSAVAGGVRRWLSDLPQPGCRLLWDLICPTLAFPALTCRALLFCRSRGWRIAQDHFFVRPQAQNFQKRSSSRFSHGNPVFPRKCRLAKSAFPRCEFLL
jgi:hypothetical protein